MQQSSAFHPAVRDQSQFLKRCKLAHDPVRSRCLQSGACSCGTQIPIARVAPPTSPHRGFLPWRFSDAGHRSVRRQSCVAGIRKPSQKRPRAGAAIFVTQTTRSPRRQARAPVCGPRHQFVRPVRLRRSTSDLQIWMTFVARKPAPSSSRSYSLRVLSRPPVIASIIMYDALARYASGPSGMTFSNTSSLPRPE